MLIHPYADGNGRTGRHLLNALLAQKDIVIPSLYITKGEQYRFNKRLDKHVIHTLTPDFDKLGEEFLRGVADKVIDISGEDRLAEMKSRYEKQSEERE